MSLLLALGGLPSTGGDWGNCSTQPRYTLSWTNAGIISSTTVSPFANNNFPLPGRLARLTETWTQSSIQVLLGTPVGKQVWETPRGSPPTFQSWIWNLQWLSVPVGNNYWENPRRNTQYLQDWVQHLQISPVVANPFVNSDWPIPQSPKRLDYTWTQSSIEALLGIPVGKQTWELPVRGFQYLQTWTQSLQLTTPSHNYDWPLPSKKPDYLQSWIQSPIPPVVVTGTPFKNSDFPVPNKSSWYLQDWNQGFDLLSQPIIAYLPSGITESGLPTGSQRSIDLLSWINPVTQTPVTYIFREPVSTKLPLPSSYDYTWVQSGIRISAVVASPFNQLDWELPRVGLQYQQTWTQSLQLTTPSKNYDFPNPVQSLRQLRDWTQGKLPSSFAGFPFAGNTDFKSYLKYYDYTWLDGFQLLNQAVQTPFQQLDWPVPGSSRSRDFTWIQRSVQVIPTPIHNFDWANPRSIPKYQDYSLDLLQTTLFSPPVTLPKNQYTWPVTLSKVPGRDLLTWIGQLFDKTAALPSIFPVIPPVLKTDINSWTVWSSGQPNGRRQRIKSWTAPFASK